MVSLSLIGASFINGYTGIRFEFNKTFSIPDSSLLDTQEFDNPVLNLPFFTVDLKNEFSLRPNDVFSFAPNTFMVQSCLMNQFFSIALQAEANPLNPISMIDYSEDDLQLYLDGTASESAYAIQPSLSYHFEIWTISNPITRVYEVTNDTGLVTVNKSSLQINKTYSVKLTVSNFLERSTLSTLTYSFVCLYPTVLSAAYSLNYASITISFSKNVS